MATGTTSRTVWTTAREMNGFVRRTRRRRRRCDGQLLTRAALAIAMLAAALGAADVRVAAASDTPLADAAERRDRATLARLIEAGADVDAAQVDGMTALHWACYHDDAATVRDLIAAEARVDAETRYGVRPLSIACRNGHLEIVQRLLAAGANPDRRLRGGETALMTAARTGRPEVVEALIATGAAVDARERRGQTALMWAAAEGHAEVVRLLIDAGAAVDARLRSGFTAFLFAIREGRIDVVDELLAAGADVDDVLGRRVDPDTKPERGTSALLLAVENAHFELALRLVDAGADPNDERSGRTPLHTLPSVRKSGRGDGPGGNPPPEGSGCVRSLEFARELVARGADVNRRLRRGRSGRALVNPKGATPFLLAAKNADVPLLRTLLDLGADPSIPNVEGSTPLLAAAGLGVRAPGEEPGTEEEALATLRLLLELGADVDVVDAQGETAMHAAAYKNAPRIVEFLAANGHDIETWNRKNDHGWTPLWIAEGFRPGNFKPSPVTVAAIRGVMRAAGVEPPPPRSRSEADPKAY